MMMLVIGGSGSGKSSYAEKAAVSLSAGGGYQKYYLATMKLLDDEGQKKADRHRALRDGKGFITIEQPTDIDKVLEKMGEGKRTVLLECILNLTANEMFSGEEPRSPQETAKKIIEGIKMVKGQVSHMVVVSGNVFEDGIVYERPVMQYLRAMGAINQELAAMADNVTEVVAGIPVAIKQEGRKICRC